MSILAKLLQKISENHQGPGQIPPGLLHSVARSAGSGKRSSYMVYSVLGAAAAIIIGYFLIMYLNLRTVPSPAPAKIVAAPPAAPVIPVAAPPAAVPAVTVQAAAVQTAISSVKPTAVRPATTDAGGGGAKKVSHAERSAKSAQLPDSSRNDRRGAAKSFAATAESRDRAPHSPKAVSRDRNTIDAYLFAASSAESRNDYLTALRQYLKAQEADPGNYRIMNNVASTFLRLGLPDEALTFANKALAQKGTYVSAMINAGIAHGKLGNESAARVMLQKAVTQEPANSQALFNLALSFECNGLVDEAIPVYKRLANGSDARGYLGMARMNEQKGNREEALRVYRDLLALPDAGVAAKDVARKRIEQLEG